MGIGDLAPEELHRLYGPWAGRTPADAARLMVGYPGTWWVAGGWAVEAFTGVVREHADLDLEVPRPDLALLRRHLAGRLDAWTATDGALRPLLPDDHPAAEPDSVLPTGCGQLWLRRGGTQPWEYDVLLMPGDAVTWTFKRDRRVCRPLDDVLWSDDGVRYLRPEVQLLLKARGRRPKDEQDFRAARDLLEPTSRRWLRETLELVHPGHPWAARL